MTESSWKKSPASSDWNASDNWTNGIPTGKAIFTDSSQTTITFSSSSNATVEAVEFSKDSAIYGLMFGSDNEPGLTITGAGVTNLSNKLQSFIVAAFSTGHTDPQLIFSNSANAGDDNVFYCAGPEAKDSYGGGIVSFIDNSSAGSATFKVWTGQESPRSHQPSTVGGEVSFSNNSSAGCARFTIYGTLGTDGDTFGNVVFHDTAKAANATFTNIGGTVSGGDGGNTQFYGTSSADNGVFENYGGTYNTVEEKGKSKTTYTPGSNGGDVAFDTNATGANGCFNNYAAPGKGSYGGVTSFNNNWPNTPGVAASAGNGRYYNHGANENQLGGGGHVSFSAKYGSPTAANGYFVNYGSAQSSKSSAGHTILSISSPNIQDGVTYDYYPTAADAAFYNHPATTEKGAAGYTEFAVFTDSSASSSNTRTGNMPTAGNSTITNLGAEVEYAAGGYTFFSGSVTAENATLIAYGGSNKGYGGKIAFYDNSVGGTARVKLYGNGELDISYHTGALTIGTLYLMGGIISTQLGTDTPSLSVSNKIDLDSEYMNFSFYKSDSGFAFNTEYTILTYSGLSGFSIDQFRGNSLDDIEPTFSTDGDELKVQFIKSAD